MKLNGWDNERQVYDPCLGIARYMLKHKNQSVKIIITGAPGRGKSELMLTMAFNVALWLSFLLHGTFNRWKEYFDYDNGNLIVIDKDKMLKLTKDKTKARYSVICIDEVQEIANALDYKETSTRAFTRVNQLFRPRGWIIFATIQQQQTHVKQSRDLYDIEIDMGDLDALVVGVNTFKMYFTSLKPLTANNSKSQYIHTPRQNGIKFVLNTNMLAPKFIRKFYLELRSTEEMKAAESSYEEITKEKLKKEAIYNKIVGGGKGKQVEEVVMEYMKKNDNKLPTAPYVQDTLAAKGVDVSENTIRKKMREYKS